MFDIIFGDQGNLPIADVYQKRLKLIIYKLFSEFYNEKELILCDAPIGDDLALEYFEALKHYDYWSIELMIDTNILLVTKEVSVRITTSSHTKTEKSRLTLKSPYRVIFNSTFAPLYQGFIHIIRVGQLDIPLRKNT